jgi:toxin CptA
LITHNAPPVVYPLGRSRFQGWLLAFVWCGGLLLAFWWAAAMRQIDWRIFLAGGCIAAAGVTAYIGWKNAPVGQLAWDGQHWRWESPGYQTGIAEQQLSVIADFQHLLLLRIENPAHASLWLWLERRALPERWLDLRRAVYSPHRLSAPIRLQGPGRAAGNEQIKP